MAWLLSLSCSSAVGRLVARTPWVEMNLIGNSNQVTANGCEEIFSQAPNKWCLFFPQVFLELLSDTTHTRLLLIALS